ncbi:MAG: hypothetical protein ACJ790_18685, partial [Myxococcaceae bacterium]
MKHAWWVLPLTAMFIAGCSCKGCSNSIDVGSNGSGGGSGGGQSAGGGTGGGDPTGDEDGGDGTSVIGVDPFGFILDGGSNSSGDGVKPHPDGGITLDSNEVQLHFMWIANNTEGTVSKFDTKTGKEVGRYYSVIPINGAGANNGLTGDPAYGNSPSRTAIDLYGDMWVANRAPGTGKQGSATKIANDVSSCVDRNGNGQIDTSKDVNGDGVIQPSEMITPTDWANPMQYDECVLFTTALGNACPDDGCVNGRAIAISVGIEQGAGDVWVGLWKDQRFYKLRSTDGAIVPVNTAGDLYVSLGFGPYGAVVDGQGRLWAVAPGERHLALIDTVSGALINDNITPGGAIGLPGAYGIAIDGKDRVWLAGWGAGAKAARYDHGPGLGASVGSWTEFDFTNTTSQNGTPFGQGRGIAADDKGYIWMSGSYNVAFSATVAQLIAFDQETGVPKKFQTGSGAVDFIDATDAVTGQSIGVGLDGDDQPWVNNYSGNVMRIDRDTGAITRTASQTGTLYTYSDFTGYALRKFVSPRGTYRQDFTGCGADTEWRSLNWTFSAPTGTSIEAYVKVANSLAALNSSSATKYGPFTTPP